LLKDFPIDKIEISPMKMDSVKKVELREFYKENTLERVDKRPLNESRNFGNSQQFFNTLKTDLNDQRVQDIQRENEVLRELKLSQEKHLADKETMIFFLNSKISQLTDHNAVLEKKMTSNTVEATLSSFKNAPLQDKSNMLHPNNQNDFIDVTQIEYMKNNVPLRDNMYENTLSKQHLLKLSSLGLNLDMSAHQSSKVNLNSPIAFEIALTIVSILN